MVVTLNNQWIQIMLLIGAQYTHSGNPFKGHKFFINPYYTAEVDAVIA